MLCILMHSLMYQDKSGHLWHFQDILRQFKKSGISGRLATWLHPITATIGGILYHPLHFQVIAALSIKNLVGAPRPGAPIGTGLCTRHKSIVQILKNQLNQATLTQCSAVLMQLVHE